MDKAYFVKYPNTYEKLLCPHFLEAESFYTIANTIILDSLDFENFVWGMDVEREYLEQKAHLCSDGVIKNCLLIKRNHAPDGILVVPDPEFPGCVLWAAYLFSP